jgi:hypothetical protein
MGFIKAGETERKNGSEDDRINFSASLLKIEGFGI